MSRTNGSSQSASIKTQLKDLIPEYKSIYLQWKYYPQMLGKTFKTFEELKNNYQMFPKGITEREANLWLLEEPVSNALNLLLSVIHKQKMVELYDIYYDRAKTDVQSFRAFIDFSKEFFADNGESELQSILKGIKIDEVD